MVDTKIRNPSNPQSYSFESGSPSIDFNSNGAAYIKGLMDDLEKGKYAKFWVYATEMLRRDARLFGEYGKRNRAVLGEWHLIPPKDARAKEKKAAEKIEEKIYSIDNIDDVLIDLNSAFYYTTSVAEFNDGQGNAWVNDADGLWMPAGIQQLSGWKFGAPDPKDNGYQEMKPMLLDKDGNPTIEFEQYKWIIHTHKSVVGNCFNSGLAASLIWTFLLKWFPLKDWVGMLEKYGVDKLVALYSSSLDPSRTEDAQVIGSINLALQDIRKFGSAAIPNSVDFKFLNSIGASSDAFQRLVEYADNSYSIAINGGVMTSIATANGLGSGAAETQNEVRLEIVEADRRQLEGTLTQQLVKPMMLLNFPGIPLSRTPKWKFNKNEVLSGIQSNKAKRVTTPAADEVVGTNEVN